ncbi:hypothetical protein [Weissella sp. MSCH1]|uniref:hypothetical protein n=1 Tax=Weissella sp. MSCH1 TaxID=3383343 RepID=UPI003896C349
MNVESAKKYLDTVKNKEYGTKLNDLVSAVLDNPEIFLNFDFFELDDKNVDEFDERYENLLEFLEKFNIQFVPYSTIANIVFQLDEDKADGMPMFLERLTSAIDKSLNKLSNDYYLPEHLSVMIKILEHFQLSISQRGSLYEQQKDEIKSLKQNTKIIEKNFEQNSKDYQEKLMLEFNEETKSNIDKLNDNYDAKIESLNAVYVNQVEKLHDSMDGRINNMYSGFISVLGIFISISFSLFGAATLIKDIFTISTEKGFDTSRNVVGVNIMLAGITTLLIYSLIVGLMMGISKVVKTNFKFNYRNFFITYSAAAGVILCGLLYAYDLKHLIHKGFWAGVILLIYVIICAIIFKNGTKIKSFFFKKG